MTRSVKPLRRAKPRKTARGAAEREQAAAPDPSRAPAQAPAGAPIDAGTLDAAFVRALEADFRQHGPTAIEAMRGEKPTDYVKLIAAVRTKDPDDPIDPLRAMSDAELDRHIEELARRAGYEIRARDGAPGEGTAADQGADAD
jgi:hypothetical protein